MHVPKDRVLLKEKAWFCCCESKIIVHHEEHVLQLSITSTQQLNHVSGRHMNVS